MPLRRRRLGEQLGDTASRAGRVRGRTTHPLWQCLATLPHRALSTLQVATRELAKKEKKKKNNIEMAPGLGKARQKVEEAAPVSLLCPSNLSLSQREL